MIRFDDDGVPVSEYAPIDGIEVGTQRSIVAIAEMGLHYWNQLHPDDPPIVMSYAWSPERDIRVSASASVDARRGLLACADWLLGNATELGAAVVWRYQYPSYYGTPAGWRSGHGQAQAFRLLLRAYELSGETAYRDAAIAAVRAFGIPTADGGFTEVMPRRRWWYAKFADVASTEPQVLNGMLFALVALDDANRALKYRHARRAFRRGAAAVVHTLPRYSLGEWSAYDRSGKRASAHYHRVHVLLLEQLAEISPRFRTRRVSRLRRQWSAADTSHARGGVHERS